MACPKAGFCSCSEGVEQRVQELIGFGIRYAFHSVKGFGDVNDSVPAILDLIELGVLDPVRAFSAMSLNPARLMAKVTGQAWWVKELGSLAEGSSADIAVINPLEKEVVYTFVIGQMVAFEGRII
jgi:imidazolonepropionase-like amidohydrolase